MSPRAHVGSARQSFKRLDIWPERRRMKALGSTVSPNVLLLFVGNPRSGTTLIRSLLAAHPAIKISQELDLVGLFESGERSWEFLCGAMLKNATQFDRAPVWNGYDYAVSFDHSGSGEIAVIGDKKASRTSAIFYKNPHLVDRLVKWCPLPVRFIHCVRNPFDVIATKTVKNNRTLARNVDIYFEREMVSVQIEARLKKQDYCRVHLEDLIAAPEDKMRELLDFLGVDGRAEYFDACAERVFDKPRRSRDSVEWPTRLRDKVQAGMLEVDYLNRYRDGG